MAASADARSHASDAGLRRARTIDIDIDIDIDREVGPEAVMYSYPSVEEPPQRPGPASEDVSRKISTPGRDRSRVASAASSEVQKQSSP